MTHLLRHSFQRHSMVVMRLGHGIAVYIASKRVNPLLGRTPLDLDRVLFNTFVPNVYMRLETLIKLFDIDA